MAVPEENIYDIQGTVLCRVISAADHELEQTGAVSVSSLAVPAQADESTAASKTQSSSFAQTSTAMSAKYGPDTLGVLGASKKRTTRLAPLNDSAAAAAGGTASASTSAAAAAADSASGGAAAKVGASGAIAATVFAHNLTAEKALAALIPPRPLPDSRDEAEAEETEDAGTGSVRDRRGSSSTVAKGKSRGQWVVVPAVDHTSRLDVVLLQQHLHRRCAEQNARPRGVLCPTRESIFNDGMMEIIRQVTVMCPERGVLLDELCAKMNQATETYDILFDSASQYAVRKSIERDLRQHLFDEKKGLESEVRRLENRVNELRAKHEGMKKRFDEQIEITKKLNEEEIAYVKKANAQLISEIKRFSALEAANN